MRTGRAGPERARNARARGASRPRTRTTTGDRPGRAARPGDAPARLTWTHARMPSAAWTAGPAPAEPRVVVDCTLGLGGHSEALLTTFPARPARRARPRPGGAAPRRRAARPVRRPGHAGARRLRRAARRARPAGIPRVQGVLFDLGVSSMQLDEADRGFAYAQDAPARHAHGPDDRHQRRRGAQHLPARANWCGSCARTARRSRPSGSSTPSCASGSEEPFTNSARLVELIRDALPQAAKRTGGNPAKRTFQALRIEVNGELTRPGAGRPRGRGGARRRRPDRRAVVPLAGGPAGQAGVRGRRGQHRAARTARRPRALPAPAQAAHPRRRTAHRGRGRREPPGRPGPAARRGADPRGRRGETRGGRDERRPSCGEGRPARAAAAGRSRTGRPHPVRPAGRRAARRRPDHAAAAELRPQPGLVPS